MPGTLRTYLRSFAGGEMSPEMFGRIDDAVFQTGAATLRNLISKPQGPAFRRPGTRLVREVKDSTKRVRLIPFTFSTDQTMVIEFGHHYLRFHTFGATLLYTTPLAAYIGPQNITSVNTGTEEITTAAHGLANGDPIYFYTTGTLPAPLVAGVRYFAIVVSSTVIKVAETQAAAIAGTPFVNLTSAGSSSTVARVYDPGDLTLYLGANHYCFLSTLGVAPAPAPSDATYFYVLPTSPNIYEIPTPYDQNDIFAIKFTQSADVMTLVHTGYAPRELRRLGAEKWVLSPISFAPLLLAPTGLIGTPYRGAGLRIAAITAASPGQLTTFSTHGLLNGDSVYISGIVGITGIPDGFYVVDTVGGNTLTLKDVLLGKPVNTTGGPYTTDTGIIYLTSLSSDNENKYVVTAIAPDGQESAQSGIATVTNNLFVDGSKNTLQWNESKGAQRYHVYKLQSGFYGFIGQVDDATKVGDDLTFIDDNIGPDLSIGPPILDTTLSGTDYPGAVGYFEGRRVFAGTPLRPQDVWMTQSGTESDLSYHIPVVDSDRIQFRVGTREVSTIRHVVPVQHLLLLTSGAELRVTPLNSDALTPSNRSVRNQTFVGSSNVQPIIVNSSVLFFAARGGHVRELGFDLTADGYLTGDMSLRAAHLFDDFTIVDAAFQKAPLPIMWCVSSSGKLLGVTYVPEQSVGAWHQHQTASDTFESVCCVAENEEDRVYVVVHRGSKRFVERMGAMAVSTLNDSYFVDCGLTYTGSPATVISGLSHLNGLLVNILADGIVRTATVAGGQVTLPVAASTVHVGLPMTSTLQTLPLAMQIEGFGQGRQKNIAHVWLRCFESRPAKAGSSEAAANLFPVLFGTGLTDLITGSDKIAVQDSWDADGTAFVVQADPVPLTIVGLTLEVAIGD